MEKVVYWGHEISAEGIAPNKEKLKAIADALAPTNITQVKSFVGLIKFYSKFESIIITVI